MNNLESEAGQIKIHSCALENTFQIGGQVTLISKIIQLHEKEFSVSNNVLRNFLSLLGQRIMKC